jgi:membrane fusion protein (multidrug efflux system)
MGQIKGETEIGLGFEVNGIIQSIRFREGQRIKKGDLIANLDPTDAQLKQSYAKAKFNSAQAAYNSVKKQLEVHQKLYEAGAIIKSKMEQVELEVESARFQLETARSEMELADNELRKTFLYAAKDGVMGPRKSEEGEFLSTQDKLGSLYETANVYAEIGVVERDIEKVRIGQNAKIYVDAYTTMTFEGKVEYIFPVVEGKSRTMTVKAKINNQNGLLIPGMFCRADLNIIELTNAYMVPASALINSNNITTLPVIPSHSIQKVSEDEQTGIPEIRRVTIGYMTSDHAQILEGVSSGDLVVLEVQGEFKEGRPVKIVGIEELSF